MEKMSCGVPPPVTGRVSAIKSQFENLTTLESLDISGTKDKRLDDDTRFQFKRANTSIDLLKRSEKARNIVSNWMKNETPSVPKQCSDSALLKSNKTKNVLNEKASKHHNHKTKKEKIEVKLSRHTSDPVKRSSIKRSPAFRVGDKQNKAILLRHNQIAPNEFNDKKFENFLQKKCAPNMDSLQQPGMTDSIKAALRQPLPSGPPPKKPPRTFGLLAQQDKARSQSFDDYKRIEEENLFKDKLNFLENNLIITGNKEVVTSSQQRMKSRTPLQKSKTEFILQGSKFLDCLSCHRVPSMVYESIDTTNEERRPLILHNIDKNAMVEMKKNFKGPPPISGNKSVVEPIYMEPFGHLKGKNMITDSFFTSAPCESSFSGDDGIDSILNSSTCENPHHPQQQNVNKENMCNCPETHKKGDLHYMCTAIDDSITGESDCTEKEFNISSLGKSYDEISILVDAAFLQKSTINEKENSLALIENRSDDNTDTKSSIKLSRTLTEKRKDYVRRIAVMPEKRIQTYGTLHRTFKSPIVKTFSLEENVGSSKSENNLNQLGDNNTGEEQIMTTSDRIDKYRKLMEVNSNSGSSSNNNNNNNLRLRTKVPSSNSSSKTITTNNEVDLEAGDSAAGEIDEFDTKEKLFQVCLLIGYNTSTMCAYTKSKYPSDHPIPDNIEQLVFPSNDIVRTGREHQEYCLILTDDNGNKVYGYCRRVLPENSEMSLPLCYCLISVTKALGFYQKVLKEIETRHGQSEIQLNFLLKNLQNSQIPEAGKYLHIKLPLSIRPKTFFSSNHKISPKRLSLEANPKWLTEAAAQAAFPEQQEFFIDSISHVKSNKKQSGGAKSLIQEFEDKKQNQHHHHQQPFDFGLINRSLMMRDPKFDEILIRRPNDLRLENTELSELLLHLGVENLICVFSSLLLERKVILQCKNISLLTKSVLALQTILYPFQWQYTIVTILPCSLIEICQAPFPVLAGILEHISFEIEDGIVIDLDSKRITQSCGDEQTIIPNSLQESLQLSLEMVDLIDQGKMLSSVLISEAFLRFFVELFGDYRQKYFHREEFIQSHQSQNVKFFLEWFVETSMFRNFCNERYVDEDRAATEEYYKIFDARLMEKSENKSKTVQNIETIVKNSKIINKKGKTFKERFRGFLHHSSSN